MKKTVSLILMAALLLTGAASAAPPAGDAEAGAGALDTTLRDKLAYIIGEYEYDLYAKSPYYKDVMAGWLASGYKAGRDEISVAPGDIRFDVQPLSVEVQGREGALWTNETRTASFTVSVSDPGLYTLDVEYAMPEGCDYTAIRSLLLDGEEQYYEMGNIQFTGLWRDVGEIRRNSIGNEVWPAQGSVGSWQTAKLRDGYALYAEPLAFYLGSGEHEFTLGFSVGSMALGGAAISPFKMPPSYAEVRGEYERLGRKEAPASATVVFEAEANLESKSDTTMRIEHDADPKTEPKATTSRKLNVFGGYRWRSAGQKATWSFSVTETGLYQIGMRAVQVWNDGLPSARRITIDGEVPFEEMLAYDFQYGIEWETAYLRDAGGSPYLFWLEAGTHTIAMETCFANIGDVVRGLDADMILLGKIIRDIIRITTVDPDLNYDYRLMTAIPTLRGDLETLRGSLLSHYDAVSALAAKKPAMASNFMTIVAQIDAMLKNPFNIPRGLEDLDFALGNLGIWYMGLREQPLLIDTFYVAQPGYKLPVRKSNFFSRIWGTILNLIMSFTKDYDNVGNMLEDGMEISETIEVWIPRGTEWAELVAELSDQTFTPSSQVAIKLNILPAGQLSTGSMSALMLSVASGTSPDVILGAEWTLPVEFAIRGAALELTQFDTFEDVRTRFVPEIFTPYKYRGGVYALPETMNFNVMFYRKDILSELGIPLPDTRKEIYDYILPMLYQKHMSAFVPADFSTYLYQHGGSYYSSDGLRTGLDTPEAYQAMEEMANIFLIYGVDIAANFFNRFRSGEMPIGMGSFALYTQFTVAAPEITGKWGIAPLPGILRDGTVDRSSGGLVGECDVILATTPHPEASWKFLDWWTSAKTQSQYAHEIESLIGVEARWNTANIDAFKTLPWPVEDLETIEEFWGWAREVPVVLGGYLTSRHVSNAWNRIVLNDVLVRDALEEAITAVNREMRMRQEEYSITGSIFD